MVSDQGGRGLALGFAGGGGWGGFRAEFGEGGGGGEGCFAVEVVLALLVCPGKVGEDGAHLG
ncbi:MAG: hypothetical protein AAF235_06030 [Planctomycetota bacterium]